MRPDWRPSSLRVLSQQLRSARATWRQRWHNAAEWWRPRWAATKQWATANRRPLLSLGLLTALLLALIVYDRPPWPPLPLRHPQTGTNGDTGDPLTPDAVWPRPGGPAGVQPEETTDEPDPRVALGGGAVDAVVNVPGAGTSDAQQRPVLTASGEQLLPPLDGDVISAFGFQVSEAHGDYRFHTGIDVAAEVGAEVRAAFSGVVTAAGFDPVWGYHVRMDLGDGRHALYGNLDLVRVKAGEAVTQGTVIGTVGKSAPAEQTGTAHVHFELELDGEAIPPGI